MYSDVLAKTEAIEEGDHNAPRLRKQRPAIEAAHIAVPAHLQDEA